MGIEKSKTGTYIDTRFRWPMKVVATAQCDFSGFPVTKSDTQRQMEYDGQGLYYTGFIPHKKFADTPQQQLLKPKIYKDPLPIRDARPIPDVE